MSSREQSGLVYEENGVLIDPKVVGVMQSKTYGNDPHRMDRGADHSKDHLQYPMVRFTRMDDRARRPEPTKDSPEYNVLHAAYRSYLLFPIERYTVDVDESIEVETGWALHSYPAEIYTIQVSITPLYIRHGLACYTQCLDSLLGRDYPNNRIVLQVYNWTNNRRVSINPRDDVFEIRLIPKQKFWITTDGGMTLDMVHEQLKQAIKERAVANAEREKKRQKQQEEEGK